MKSVLAKIKANKFRSAMIGTCIFLFGFITVTVFSNINDTYAAQTCWVCDAGGGKFNYQCSSSNPNSNRCSSAALSNCGGCSGSTTASACYLCGNSQNGEYKWGNYSGNSSCNKTSKSQSECSGSTATCYLCGNSQNGEYKWGDYSSNSSCNKVSKSQSECSGSSSKSACYICGDSQNGEYKWGDYSSNSSCNKVSKSQNECIKNSESGGTSGSGTTGSGGGSTTGGGSSSSGGNSGNDVPEHQAPIDEETKPSEPIKTVQYYKITYDLDGGKLIDGKTSKIQYIEGNKTIEAPKTNPIKDGYSFSYYEYNGNKFNFGSKLDDLNITTSTTENGTTIKEIKLKAIYAKQNSKNMTCKNTNAILEPTAAKCYIVQREDSTKEIYTHTLSTYSAGDRFCYADGVNNQPGGIYIHNGVVSKDEGKKNSDEKIYANYSSDTWVSENNCFLGSKCSGSEPDVTGECKIRWETILYQESKAIDNNKTNDEINKNSKTGDALIQFVWIIGICALGYSIYYFKNRKLTKKEKI